MSANAPATAAPGRTSALAGTRQVVSDYVELTKPKVQSLLLLTTITSMEIAGSPSVSKIGLTCVGGYLSAGGAGAVNHVYDRDIDALMARTASRPIPAGRVSPRAGLVFGFALAAASFVLLSLTVNVLAASLAQRVAFAESLTNGQTVFDLDPASAASTEAAALMREAMEFAHAQEGGDATAPSGRSDAR